MGEQGSESLPAPFVKLERTHQVHCHGSGQAQVQSQRAHAGVRTITDLFETLYKKRKTVLED